MLHNNNFVWHWICQYLFMYLFIYLWPWTTKLVIRVFFFFKWDVYIIWRNKLSIDVWFVMIGQYLAEMQLFEHL